jgi:hypothetical protein
MSTWVPVELMDAGRFFDMPGVAQLNAEPDPDTCGFRRHLDQVRSCIRRSI